MQAMNFLLAILAWVVIGVILGIGVYLATVGHAWVLFVIAIALLIFVGKIGYTHG
jgi:hypothetical protein